MRPVALAALLLGACTGGQDVPTGRADSGGGASDTVMASTGSGPDLTLHAIVSPEIPARARIEAVTVNPVDGTSLWVGRAERDGAQAGYVARVDSLGSLLWDHVHETAPSGFRAVSPASGGGAWIGGWQREGKTWGDQALVIRLDGEGGEVARVMIGGSDSEHVSALSRGTPDLDGTITAVGWSASRDGAFEGAQNGHRDAFAARIGPDGALSGVRTWGGSDEDVAAAVSASGRWVAGWSVSGGTAGSFEDAGNGWKDMLLAGPLTPGEAGEDEEAGVGMVEAGSRGDLHWQRGEARGHRFGGATHDEATAVADWPGGGGGVLAGWTLSSDWVAAGRQPRGDHQFDKDSPGGWQEGVLARFDSTGELGWTRTYAGSDLDLFLSVAVSSRGWIAAGGETRSTDGPFAAKTSPLGASDRLMRLKPAGTDGVVVLADAQGRTLSVLRLSGGGDERIVGVEWLETDASHPLLAILAVTRTGFASPRDRLASRFHALLERMGVVHAAQMDGRADAAASGGGAVRLENPATGRVVATLPAAEMEMEMETEVELEVEERATLFLLRIEPGAAHGKAATHRASSPAHPAANSRRPVRSAATTQAKVPAMGRSNG